MCLVPPWGEHPRGDWHAGGAQALRVLAMPRSGLPLIDGIATFWPDPRSVPMKATSNITIINLAQAIFATVCYALHPVGSAWWFWPVPIVLFLSTYSSARFDRDRAELVSKSQTLGSS